MNGSLTLSSSYIFADCTLSSDSSPFAQSGVGSFIFGFMVRFDVKKMEHFERVLLNLEGNILLNGKIITRVQANDPVNIHGNKNGGYYTAHGFHAYLTRANLEEIERVRDGRDIAFDIQLSGSVLGGERMAEKVSATIPCRIEQTQWLKLLSKWNFGDRVFLEIPLVDAQSELHSAFEFYKKAQVLFFSGHWEQTVAECRKVLDVIHHAFGKDASLQGLLQKKRENCLQDRLLVCLLSIKQICDPASHGDENSVSIRWSRSDAELVLHQTALCLNRATKP